jgi:hypothetical protein
MKSDRSLDVAVEIEVSFDHGSRKALYQQIVDRIWCDVIEGPSRPTGGCPRFDSLPSTSGSTSTPCPVLTNSLNAWASSTAGPERVHLWD